MKLFVVLACSAVLAISAAKEFEAVPLVTRIQRSPQLGHGGGAPQSFNSGLGVGFSGGATNANVASHSVNAGGGGTVNAPTQTPNTGGFGGGSGGSASNLNSASQTFKTPGK